MTAYYPLSETFDCTKDMSALGPNLNHIDPTPQCKLCEFRYQFTWIVSTPLVMHNDVYM